MLKIGKMTDYAMLITSAMAKTPDAVLSASMLAEQTALRLPTVSKILKTLCEAKLVNSLRGAEGGYKLSRNRDAISIVDVIEAMEGGVGLTACCDMHGKCNIKTSCTMRDNWQRLNNMMQRLLAQFTIADMLTPMSDRQISAMITAKDHDYVK